MDIYISHSTSFDFKGELYKPLRENTLTRTFILPHEMSDSQYPVKEIFDEKNALWLLRRFPSLPLAKG